MGESNVIVSEGFQGITNVKSFTNEGHEVNRYKKITIEIVQEAIRYAISRGSFFHS